MGSLELNSDEEALISSSPLVETVFWSSLFSCVYCKLVERCRIK